MKVDINQLYKMKNALGSGTYSVVKLAPDKRTGEEVAIKVIAKSQLSSDDVVSLNVSCLYMNSLCIERSKYYVIIKTTS